MYQGVIRDDARRKEKMRERHEELEKSVRRREVYETVQVVAKDDGVEC